MNSTRKNNISYKVFSTQDFNLSKDSSDPHDLIVKKNKPLYEANKKLLDELLSTINKYLNSSGQYSISLETLYLLLAKKTKNTAIWLKPILLTFIRTLPNPNSDETKHLIKTLQNKSTTIDFIFNSIFGIKKSTSDDINYTALHSNGTGFCEMQGRRPTQEDRFLIGDVAVDSADRIDWKRVLIKSVNQLQENVTREVYGRNLQGGSCLCTNIITKDKIYTANLGDSTTYIVTINDDGSVTTRRLNERLHHATDEEEKTRIEAEGGRVFNKRLNGLLSVSRAIGDNEQTGISHEPDIYVNEIPNNGISFLITACDGLTEKNVNEDRIGQIVKENRNKSPEEIAKSLATEAYTQGSQDNISVIVTPLSKNQPQQDKSVRYTGGYDGHNGDAVAELLYQQFEDVLQENISNEYLLTGTQKYQESVSRFKEKNIHAARVSINQSILNFISYLNTNFTDKDAHIKLGMAYHDKFNICLKQNDSEAAKKALNAAIKQFQYILEVDKTNTQASAYLDNAFSDLNSISDDKNQIKQNLFSMLSDERKFSIELRNKINQITETENNLFLLQLKLIINEFKNSKNLRHKADILKLDSVDNFVNTEIAKELIYERIHNSDSMKNLLAQEKYKFIDDEIQPIFEKIHHQQYKAVLEILNKLDKKLTWVWHSMKHVENYEICKDEETTATSQKNNIVKINLFVKIEKNKKIEYKHIKYEDITSSIHKEFLLKTQHLINQYNAVIEIRNTMKDYEQKKIETKPTSAQYAESMVNAASLTRQFERDRIFVNEDPLWKKLANFAVYVFTFGFFGHIPVGGEYGNASTKLKHNIFEPLKNFTQDKRVTKNLAKSAPKSHK